MDRDKDKSLRTPPHPHMHSWILNHDIVRAEVSRKYPPSGTVRIAIRFSVGIIRRPPNLLRSIDAEKLLDFQCGSSNLLRVLPLTCDLEYSAPTAPISGVGVDIL